MHGMMPIMKPKRFKSCLCEIRIDCKMFVKSSVPHIEKKKLPNVNRKSNYHVYIHKSTKFSASVTKLIITLLNLSVRGPGSAVAIVSAACLVPEVPVNQIVTNCTLLFYQC